MFLIKFNLKQFLLLLLLFFLQGSYIWTLPSSIIGLKPNLLLIFLILLSLSEDMKTAILWGIIIGLLIDISSTPHLINTFCFPILACLTTLFKNDIFYNKNIISIISVVIGTIIWIFIYFSATRIIFNIDLGINFTSMISIVISHALLTPFMIKYI